MIKIFLVKILHFLWFFDLKLSLSELLYELNVQPLPPLYDFQLGTTLRTYDYFARIRFCIYVDLRAARRTGYLHTIPPYIRLNMYINFVGVL